LYVSEGLLLIRDNFLRFLLGTCAVRYEAGGALPSVQAAAAIARALKITLDDLAGISSNVDPELSRMISRLEELSDQDRAMARRFLGLLLGEGK